MLGALKITAVILGFCAVCSVGRACDLNGKAVTGQVVTCDKRTGKCDQGIGQRIKFLGNKVFDYGTDDTGLIYTIDETVNALTDPSHYAHFKKIEQDNGTGLRMTQYLITATRNGDVVTLKQDTAHVVRGVLGKNVTSVSIKFTSCHSCQFVTANTNTWYSGTLVWSSTLRRQTCEVQ